MRALLGLGGAIPLTRVVGDYRAWIVPLVVAIAANIGVLVAFVLPLTAAADAAERRAEGAAAARAAAGAELRAAEQARDGSVQAAADLERFYGEVLPADVAAARRLTHLKVSQLARQHQVAFQRSSASPEQLRDSSLERLRVSYALEGDYDDIRAFIHAIETAPEFLVIENVVLSEGRSENAPLALTLDLSTYFRAASRAR